MTGASERILAATIEVLAIHGLTDCSVERIAAEADCAKGLVNYHFRAKDELLKGVARLLGRRRASKWVSAIRTGTGASAIDALWRTLQDGALSKEGTAGAALLGLPEARTLLNPDRDETATLAREGEAATGLDRGSLPGGLLVVLLTGVELQLWSGGHAPSLRESYERFWLSLLPPP